MKATLTKLRTTMKSLWADEAAQGATEYILLLVVVVGLAMVFKPQISDLLKGKMDEVKNSIDTFKSGQ